MITLRQESKGMHAARPRAKKRSVNLHGSVGCSMVNSGREREEGMHQYLKALTCTYHARVCVCVCSQETPPHCNLILGNVSLTAAPKGAGQPPTLCVCVRSKYGFSIQHSPFGTQLMGATKLDI